MNRRVARALYLTEITSEIAAISKRIFTSAIQAASFRLERVLLMPLHGHLFVYATLAVDLQPPNRVLPTSDPGELWLFLPIGYLVSILIETPVLLIGLSRQITFRQRIFAGVWLTACTYPIVVLVMPVLFANSSRWLYLLVAETFAPVAECALFWLAIQRHIDLGLSTKLRNFGIIVLANLLSFTGGEILNATRWFGLF